MSLVSTIDTFKFPGQPALFAFKEYVEPGMHLHLEEKRILYNMEKNPKCLINRVDICRKGLDIVEISIFYKAIGCMEVKQACKKRLKGEFTHSHKWDWCNLRVSDQHSIRVLLKELYFSHGFLLDSKTKMLEMLPKL